MFFFLFEILLVNLFFFWDFGWDFGGILVKILILNKITTKILASEWPELAQVGWQWYHTLNILLFTCFITCLILFQNRYPHNVDMKSIKYSFYAFSYHTLFCSLKIMTSSHIQACHQRMPVYNQNSKKTNSKQSENKQKLPKSERKIHTRYCSCQYSYDNKR